jgi:hypothetical protein
MKIYYARITAGAAKGLLAGVLIASAAVLAGCGSAPVTVTALPAPTAVTTVAQWRAGPGGALLLRTSEDLTGLESATSDGSFQDQGMYALALSQDALAAEKDPPPGKDRGVYIVAMGALNAAGQSVQDGNLTAAAKQLDLAAGLMNSISLTS